MEEKDNEKNDDNNEEKNILDIVVIEKEDNNIKNIKMLNGEDNEEERILLDVPDDNKEEIELGSKIQCPRTNCFNNCIILIDPIELKVTYDCGEHKNKMDIIDFVKKSGISKEDKEKCSICKQTYDSLKKDINNNKLYKCKCGKNYCQKCKNKHFNEFKEEKDEHNMIEFKYKDYTCVCNDKKKKYSSFCITCQKNLCIACTEKHKDHEKRNFGELFSLTEEKHKQLDNSIIIQKKRIDKVCDIIDDWLRRVKRVIDDYKKKLEFYYKINLIISKNYNKNKLNYEKIKNTEYICTDFDDNFNNLFNSENDFKKLNSIICNILNENMKHFIGFPDFGGEKMIKDLEIVYREKFNGEVKHLCELKKENLFIVDIFNNNNNKDELCIFKQIKEHNIVKAFDNLISVKEDSKILSLKELKNGTLLIVKKKEFKIVEININENTLKHIQLKRLEDKNEIFNDVIELINGNLVSISYTKKNGDDEGIIYFWNKNLRKGFFEIYKTVTTEKEIPISIIEINKEQFVVLFNNNRLNSYDSKSGEKTQLLESVCNSHFKKMIKVIEDGILFLYENNIILFCISSLQVKSLRRDYNIYDICYINGSNNYYIVSFNESNRYGLSLLKIDLIKYKIYKMNDINIPNAHEGKINCIYHLNKNNIVTGSEDETIKIWSFKK